MASLVMEDLVSLKERMFPDLTERKGLVRNIFFEQKEETSPEEEIMKDNLDILKHIQLPERFRQSDVEEFLERKVKKDLENPFHQLVLKIQKYVSDFHNKHSLYFATIFDLHDKMAEMLQHRTLFTAQIYIISELPSSFQKTVALSFMTELKLLGLVNTRMRQERVRFLGARSNDVKFDRLCEAHNRWINPLLDITDDMIDKRTRLLWYLEFNGSRTLSELFKLKPYKMSDYDSETYYSHIKLLQRSVESLRSLLLKYDRKRFVESFDNENPTTELFAGMAQVIA